MTAALHTTDWFAPALAGQRCQRHDDDGHHTELPVRRWHAPPEPAERALLGRCQGSTVDVGCGPGRLAGALAGRGVLTLGVDTSAYAVRLTRDRGADALCRSIFDRLPREGRWEHVLLVDGNVGIGGDPAGLLNRCATLLCRTGTVLVEVEPPGAALWRGLSRIAHPAGQTGPFPWARVGLDTVERLCAGGVLALGSVLEPPADDGRWFVELARKR